MDIWFSSDWHFGHRNLIRGETNWIDRQTRDFDSVSQHDNVLVDNINKVVKKSDILYCLGDFSMGGKDKIYGYRYAINCKNLHLILGNHDQHLSNNSIIFTGKGYVNSRNIFSSVQDMLHKKIMGQNISMCHYGLRPWPKASRGAWCLHGHCHGSLTPLVDSHTGLRYRSMDVGIDTHPEFRPYNMDELKELLNSHNFVDFKEDHH